MTFSNSLAVECKFAAWRTSKKKAKPPNPPAWQSSLLQVWLYKARTDMASVNTVIQICGKMVPLLLSPRSSSSLPCMQKWKPSFILWETFIRMQSVLPSALDEVEEVWGKERGTRLSCYVYQGMQRLAIFQHALMKHLLWLTYQKKKLLCSSVQTHTSSLTVPTKLQDKCINHIHFILGKSEITNRQWSNIASHTGNLNSRAES